MQTNKKKPDKREIWTDEDYCQLLIYSYQGTDRKTLQSILGRSTAKIFSKLQKHMLLAKNVIKSLISSPIKSLSDRITMQHLEQICPGCFKNIQRYLIVMKTLALYLESQNLATFKKAQVTRMIPQFLQESTEDVNQLTI